MSASHLALTFFLHALLNSLDMASSAATRASLLGSNVTTITSASESSSSSPLQPSSLSSSSSSSSPSPPPPNSSSASPPSVALSNSSSATSLAVASLPSSLPLPSSPSISTTTTTATTGGGASNAQHSNTSGAHESRETVPDLESTTATSSSRVIPPPEVAGASAGNTPSYRQKREAARIPTRGPEEWDEGVQEDVGEAEFGDVDISSAFAYVERQYERAFGALGRARRTNDLDKRQNGGGDSNHNNNYHNNNNNHNHNRHYRHYHRHLHPKNQRDHGQVHIRINNDNTHTKSVQSDSGALSNFRLDKVNREEEEVEKEEEEVDETISVLGHVKPRKRHHNSETFRPGSSLSWARRGLWSRGSRRNRRRRQMQKRDVSLTSSMREFFETIPPQRILSILRSLIKMKVVIVGGQTRSETLQIIQILGGLTRSEALQIIQPYSSGNCGIIGMRCTYIQVDTCATMCVNSYADVQVCRGPKGCRCEGARRCACNRARGCSS